MKEFSNGNIEAAFENINIVCQNGNEVLLGLIRRRAKERGIFKSKTEEQAMEMYNKDYGNITTEDILEQFSEKELQSIRIKVADSGGSGLEILDNLIEEYRLRNEEEEVRG